MNELFGRRLRLARMARRMEQEELGRRVGRSVNSISRYERGKQPAPRAVVMAMGQVLGVEEGYFEEEDEGLAMGMLGVSGQIKGLPRGLGALTIKGARGVKASERRLAVLGRVPAGDLEEAIEEASEYLPATAEHAEVADFVLRVEGESMYPLLVEGDLVGVRVQPVAESGEVVVARVYRELEAGGRGEGEVGVKVYRRDRLGERLESVNPVYAPIRPPFEVIGVVSWVHRDMRGKKDRVKSL